MDEIRQVLMVGSGGNSVAIAARLNEADIDFHVITAHSDYGGAWWANTYPGCGVDTPALNYQLECALGTPWTRSHPEQGEILAYFQRVAREQGMYERTDFDTEMTSCRWDGERDHWIVDTSKGEYRSHHLILATGFLDTAITDAVPGSERFRGRYFHSQEWPEGYTGDGDRIAVLGTGSSGIQIVPSMQPVAESVVVFQRSPNWILPKKQHVFTDDERELLTTDLDGIRRQREENAAAYRDAVHADKLNEPVLGFRSGQKAMEEALRFLEEEVADPELRALLTPDFNFACKRPGFSDDYFRALQEPNVELVPEAAAEITEDGVVAHSGRLVEVDTIVLATGFRWGTNILERVIRRDGQPVAAAQSGHPRAYKGIQVSQCPNLYLIGGGPNGRAHSIMSGLRTGEIASNYVVMMIERMETMGVSALEVTEAAETEWKRRADEINARGSAMTGECTNYITDDHGCNMADWPGDDVDHIRQHTTFVAEHYCEPDRAPLADEAVSA